MGMACSTNWGEEESSWVLAVKPEGRRPLGIPRRKRVNNMKMGVRNVAYDRDQWRALEPACYITFWEVLE
jgi:hypothetical protein